MWTVGLTEEINLRLQILPVHVVWTGPNSPGAQKVVPVLSLAPVCFFNHPPCTKNLGQARRAMDTGWDISLPDRPRSQGLLRRSNPTWSKNQEQVLCRHLWLTDLCFAGFIADSAGAYGPAFFAAGGIMVFGSSLVLLIKFTRKLLLGRRHA